jgi:hypothetical protein
MQFTDLDKHGKATMVHDGVEHTFTIADWTHPPLVAGHPELGLDETLLVSPEVEDENGRHTVYVPVHGDPGAQALHVAHRVHHGKKKRARAVEEVRGHVERLGGHWHLNDDGERHAAPVLPYVPPEERPQPEEPPMTRQQFLDLAMRFAEQLPQEAADADG